MSWARFIEAIRWKEWMPANQPGGRLNSSEVGRWDGSERSYSALTRLPRVFYYVNEDTLPLLECPRSDCLPLQLLFRGDQVQRVEEGDQGWWRVLVIKSRSLGWVPASALTEQIEDTQQKQIRKPYYYVAVGKLILRAKPSNRGQVIRTLRFNDQVQKIGETKDWFQVRQPSTGALGWVISRDLETFR